MIHGIWSTSGRYASYWNVFLCSMILETMVIVVERNHAQQVCFIAVAIGKCTTNSFDVLFC